MSQSGLLSNKNAQSSSKSKAAACVCVSESTHPYTQECFSENVTELINAGSCHRKVKGDGDIALYFFLQLLEGFKYSSLLHCVPNVVTAFITEAVC